MNEHMINANVLSNLNEALGTDAMHDFLGRFFDDCHMRTRRIIDAYANGNFAEVELEAHTLGTSAATYGAAQLEQLCRQIEMADYSQQADILDQHIKSLEILSEESVQALKAYVA